MFGGPRKQEISLEDMAEWNEKQNVWAECSDGRTHKVLGVGKDNVVQTYYGEKEAVSASIVVNSDLKKRK